MAHDWTLETIDLGRVRTARPMPCNESTMLKWLRKNSPHPALLMLEHDPAVITVSKRAGAEPTCWPHRLWHRSGRPRTHRPWGDVTWHGPGQLVAWPIVDLNRFGLGLHAWMR